MHCPAGDDAFVSSFCCFLSQSEASALFVQGVHSSNKHCVAVYRPISTRFSAFFFSMGDLLRCTTKFSFLSLGGATSFAKLRSKIAKSPKIGGKVCAHDHSIDMLCMLWHDFV